MENTTKKDINAELRVFCKSSDSALFVLAQHCSMIRGKGAFAKMPLAPTLIGLIFVDAPEFDGAARCNKFLQLNMAGFYSTATDTVYLTPFIETGITCYAPYGAKTQKARQFPIQYKPIPTKEMLNKLGKELTLRLMPDLQPTAFDVNNPNDTNCALEAFFDEAEKECMLNSDDFKTIDCENYAEYALLTNNNIAMYIENPEKWVNVAADMVMGEPTVRKILTSRLQQMKNTQTILETIKNDPNHYWHKIKQLVDAIRGKKTVVVRLHSGIKFRIETEQLYRYTGTYMYWGDYDVSAGVSVHKKNIKNQHLEFKIDDIQQVLYREKTIFGTAE